MGKTSRQNILFILSIACQFAVLLGMIFFYQSIVLGGTEVILKTNPVDPRDILRGNYVALSYEISRIDASQFANGGSYLSGDTIYVTLASGSKSGGAWRVSGIHRSKPASGTFLKGTVASSGQNEISAHYGIESYFTDQAQASELEREARRGSLLMRVVVDKNGKGVVRGAVDATGGSSISSFQSGPVGRSRDSRRITDVKQLQLALELYYDGKDAQYPVSLSDVVPDYMPAVPVDPLDRTPYHYMRCSPGSYHMGTDLEDVGSVALNSDADATGFCSSDPIHGDDRTSCDGARTDRACYDLKEGEPESLEDKNLPARSIVVLSPNGNETFRVGTVQTIRWSVKNLRKGDTVRVKVREEGSNRSPIILSEAANNTTTSDQWQVNIAPYRFYKVIAEVLENGKKSVISDGSNAPFSVIPK